MIPKNFAQAPLPGRIVTPGSISLAAGATKTFLGENARKRRIYFCVDNIDATLRVDLALSNGSKFAAVFPSSSKIYLTDEDIIVSNPDTGAAVTVYVCELYPNIL
jgi:hypothetical protein